MSNHSHLLGPRPRTIRPPKPHDGWTKAQLWARILALEAKLQAVRVNASVGAVEAHARWAASGSPQIERSVMAQVRDDMQAIRDTATVPDVRAPGQRICEPSCRCRPCRKERGE